MPDDTNGVRDVFVFDRSTDAIERVSVAGDGTQANGASAYSALSADGRYVAFESEATNLVPDDTNGVRDVFVFDRATGAIERVSVAGDGTQANFGSAQPGLSADGQVVAFISEASNLVPDDNNGSYDVFVFDRVADAIERVSVASDGTEAVVPTTDFALSADGQVVAFSSEAMNLVPGDTNSVLDVFVFDRASHTTERVSVASDGAQGIGNSFTPALSADGRFVAFSSDSWNLVPGDNNGLVHVFVFDRDSDTIERVSVAGDGTQANSDGYLPRLSADGRYVAFHSMASNLVPGDTNGVADIFVRRLGSEDQVEYAFTGFFEPVQMGALNLVTANRTIPLKFHIDGGFGLDAVSGSPTVRRISCQTDEPVSDIDDGETTSSGKSGYEYDATTDEYQYNWKTQRSYAGSCRQVTLTLADGTNYFANFQFR